jgi:hypothetical protein
MRHYLTTIEHFTCECLSDEHTLRFIFDEEEIWTSVFLNQYHSWWMRIWIGLKYVLGYKCKYGHFDCFIMRSEDVDRMMQLLQRFKDQSKT